MGAIGGTNNKGDDDEKICDICKRGQKRRNFRLSDRGLSVCSPVDKPPHNGLGLGVQPMRSAIKILLDSPAPLEREIILLIRERLAAKIKELDKRTLRAKQAYLRLQQITGIDSHRLRRWLRDLKLDPYDRS